MSLPRPSLRFWLLAIVVIAFALRLALVLHGGERPLVNDETGYDQIAGNLANGYGYQVGLTDDRRHPTAGRGPAYVFFVAAFYKVAGHRLIPPLVGQCVLEVLSCLLVFWIARRLFASTPAGLAAAGLYAFYPPFIFNSSQLITETFTSFTLLSAVAAFLSYVDRRRVRDLVLTGVALGLCALNKPHAAPIAVLLPFIALPVLGFGKAIRTAAAVTLVTLLVMAPWIVRNAVVFRTFIPGVSIVGFTFWGGTAPGGGIRMIGSVSDSAVPDSVGQFAGSFDDEIAQNRWFMQEGIRIIKSDPSRYARLSFRKIFQLWFNLGFDEPPSRASYALAVINVAAFALAIYALCWARADRLAARLMVVMLVFWTLANLPAPTVVRYAMPYYALLFCYTGAGMVRLVARITGVPNEEPMKGVA